MILAALAAAVILLPAFLHWRFPVMGAVEASERLAAEKAARDERRARADLYPPPLGVEAAQREAGVAVSRKLTNKQLLVLDVLRRHPAGLDCKTVASVVTDEGVEGPCRYCDASGHVEHHYTGETVGCWACDGTGERKPYFLYSDAYQALQRLRKVGLVTRRCKRDEWGDEVPTHVYFAAAEPDHDDPLEQAFALPAAPEPRP